MRDNDKDILVNTKHKTLRIVLFILAVAVAVTAFTVGVLQIGRKEEGYQTVTAESDDEAVTYANGLSFFYFMTGKSNDIKMQLKELTVAYSGALKRSYKFLDSSNEYSGYSNIATLNKVSRTGDMYYSDTVNIGSELYDILKKAYEYTLRGEGYNMFAGGIYAYWNTILSLSNPEEFDPALNEDEAERLQRLTAATNDTDNFSLEFADDNFTVRFGVSKEYVALLDELEIPKTHEAGGYTILDLNILHDAFLLSWVGSELELKGYSEGYFETDSGLLLSLSGNRRGEYVKYDFSLTEPAQTGAVKVNGRLAVSLFRNVSIGDADTGRYSVSDGSAEFVRSSYINSLTGRSSLTVANSYVIDSKGDIIEAAYRNTVLAGADGEESLREAWDKCEAAGMSMEYEVNLRK